MDVYFRHENIRDQQKQLIEDCVGVLERGEHLLAHAPSGLGKTDSVLGSAMTIAHRKDLSVFFLTPKISQHIIAIDVVKGIAEKYGLDTRGVDIIGRKYACIDPTITELDQDGFYHICERKRKNELCNFYRTAKGYSKIEEERAERLFKKFLSVYGNGKTHVEVIKECEECSVCPYEFMMKLAINSDVVIADYFHLLLPKIRDVLLSKMKKKLDKLIVVIDEGHNLPKRIRDSLSSAVSTHLIGRVEKEMEFLSLPKLRLEKCFEDVCERLFDGRDGKEVLVAKEDFAYFFEKVGFEERDLTDYLEKIGTEFIEKTGKRSACLRLSRFLDNWASEEEGTISICLRKDGRYLLKKRFLDPKILSSMFNDTYSSIIMSGTLWPLEMYRDILGLERERTVMKCYASPFPKQNRLNLIVDSTTTRYSRRNFKEYSKIAEAIEGIVGGHPRGGIAVFFPSYVVLNAVCPLIRTSPMFVQRERMKPTEIAMLLSEFRKHRGMLACVQGGSLAEGIDFSDGEIRIGIIVGIGLEEMGLEIKALIDYYDDKFGKGWEYGYLYPAVSKALQAAGRAIRKEDDRAVLIFMDERFKWKNYRTLLPKDEKFVITNEPEKYVEEFFSSDG